jgi:hypothetical protein
MKSKFLTIATLAITFAVNTGFAQQNKPLEPGDKLPRVDLTMKDATNGRNMPYFKAGKDNGLMVMFSCNTCPFVVKNEGTAKKAMDYARSHGVGVVIINSNEAKRGDEDSYDAMKAYAAKQEYWAPYLIDEDSKLADLFGANHTPEVFLFDKNNVLVYKGAMNDNPGNPEKAKKMYINDAMDAMIAGKPVEPKSTKSIGCSIKRKA